jgi:hypothetical protein
VIAADAFGGLIVLGILVGLYFLPTIIAANRKVSSVGSIAVINTFLGWTLIGWVVALAMAVRTVPPSEGAAAWQAAVVTGPTRDCPNCKRSMPRRESTCPHCGTKSAPMVFHAGVWWSKGKSNEWQWIDEKAHVWRWYKDGTPSDPAAVDKTPNLAIDPAVVNPPAAAVDVQAQPRRSAPDVASVAGELERLVDLHARGALSDDQFEAAKNRLLEA